MRSAAMLDAMASETTTLASPTTELTNSSARTSATATKPSAPRKRVRFVTLFKPSFRAGMKILNCGSQSTPRLLTRQKNYASSVRS